MVPSKRFEVEAPVNSLSFHTSGDLLLTASSRGQSMQVMSVADGRAQRPLYSKKYGVAHARFTHHRNNIIYASTHEDDALRYMSLHDNRYLGYMRGHKGLVTGVEVNPVNDHVLSVSQDGTLRLWDLRSPQCQGLIHLETPRSICAWDARGTWFAVGRDDVREVRLFDMRSFDSGPFKTWGSLHAPDAGPMSRLLLSPDGQNALVATEGNVHLLVDAVEGRVKRALNGHQSLGPMGCGEDVCFTPDGKFVLGGSATGEVHVWDVEEGRYDGQSSFYLDAHKSPVHGVAFNPSYAVMATAASEVVGYHGYV
ncbi:WD40-repeat-containing domain protein [Piptocephalis cylindrospora]|uniref:WD40-repeat-containing domain protein n=1 Tax=Piptocephalis cylindrospora TaxID=1907219 RepID=A0A4P9Y056_9FUNG|nr:WD40-repeat-containing domain protein [Piptocephalis cylindrospora]|eukprot:RKP12158.1 WD40-repeat-containing domain protein [Piptocephalis cylindrospora]